MSDEIKHFDLSKLANISEKLKTFPKKEQKAFWFGIACALTMALGFIDYLSVPELSYYMFYLIPVFIATWFVGVLGGYAILLLCSFFWFMDFNMYMMLYAKNVLIPYWNIFLKIGFFACFVQLTVLFDKLFQNEVYYARVDIFTGAANRKYFREWYEECRKEEAGNKTAGSFLYIDLDNLKHINETMGEDEGDRIIRSLADVLAESVKPNGKTGRAGGDEFVAFLPGTDFKVSEELIKKIMLKLSASGIGTRGFSASIGCVTYGGYLPEFNVASREAESQMDRAKRRKVEKTAHILKVKEPVETLGFYAGQQ